MQQTVLTITCDVCGHSDEETVHTTEVSALAQLRERGWSVTARTDYCWVCTR